MIAARIMNQENNSKVTVAIPTFNRASLLDQTIESVLGQSHINIELIVSDNFSSDNTSDIVASYQDERIVYFRQARNLGMVGNWNFCLEHATGEYFLLLSDDDLLAKSAIENLLLAFSDESIVLSYSPVTYIDKDTVPIPGISLRAPHLETGEGFITNALRGKRVVFPAAALYRTKNARKIGGYPDIGTATDFAFHLMMAMLGRVAHNPRPLVRYRMHSLSLSYTEQAIHSQANLVDWVRCKSCPLNKLELQIIKYVTNSIIRWLKFYVVEGSQENAELGLRLLQRLSPSKKWAIWFYFFNTPVYRGWAKIHLILKQWAKRLIYGGQ